MHDLYATAIPAQTAAHGLDDAFWLMRVHHCRIWTLDLCVETQYQAVLR